MSNARNLARLIVDSGGDVDVSSLGNVPPSNDASALTTGTLPVGRLPSSGVDASSLTTGILNLPVLPTDSVLQIKSVVYSQTTTNSTSYSYIPVTGSDLTFTTKGTNSKFLLIADANGYGSTIGGINLGFYRDTNLIRGYYPGGTTGDMWMAGFNGWSSSGSLNMSKNHLDSPALSAGATITYKVALGVWTGSFSINYSGYGGTSSFTVIEIAA